MPYDDDEELEQDNQPSDDGSPSSSLNPTDIAAIRSAIMASQQPRKFGPEALAEAQRVSNQMKLGTGLSQAGSNIGYAIAGVKNPNQGAFADQQAQAEAPISQFTAANKLENEDLARGDKTNNEVFNYLSKKATQDRLAVRDKKLDDYRQNTLDQRDDKADSADSKIAAKEDASFSKQLSQFGDALDPTKGRAGEFGKQQGQVYAAKRVLQLEKQFPGGDIPGAQMGELALATGALVSAGSHAAEATVSRLVPSTYSGSVAGIQQWLESAPKGAGQQAFAKLMFDTAKREKELAEQNIMETKLSRVSQFEHLAGDPGSAQEQRFQNVMKAHGISPDVYNSYKQNNFQIPPAASAQSQETPRSVGANPALSPQDQQAIDWAKQNASDPRAKKILQLHGM